MPFFRRGYYITLNRVHDKVNIREGSETLTLTVDNDANSLIKGLLKAQKRLSEINAEETTEEEQKKAAFDFAASIFGEIQAQRLFNFYNGDPRCVVTVCGMYFSDPKHGLGKKITKAQKKTR